MREYRASITVGNRTYSEIVDMKNYREYFEESSAPEHTTWEEWTRPVHVLGEEGYETLKGNHLLYGYIEGLFQSDRSPFFCLTEFNKSKVWSYSFD